MPDDRPVDAKWQTGLHRQPAAAMFDKVRTRRYIQAHSTRVRTGAFVDTGTHQEKRVAPGRSPMHTKVLMLNRSYLPIHVTSVRRAFTLLYLGIARAVNERYQTFDFKGWSDLSASVHEETVGMVDHVVRVPRVILLVRYDRAPRRQVRFSRYNIYARDRSTCQYCGRRLPRHQLNLDHVIPRSRGGASRWENVVCSCVPCNRRKGGRTPQEARMTLLREPLKPRWTPLVQDGGGNVRYREWLPFLSPVDASYWNAALLEE